MASLHMLQLNFEMVEKRFQQCIEVAETGKKHLNKNKNHAQSTFIWQNNLLKFYLTHNISKAIDFSSELIEDEGKVLPKSDLGDLKFTKATALCLHGDPFDLP